MKLSIITPTYNSQATVAQTLQSVASQSYLPHEHIIIDGASTDNTLDIVGKYKHVTTVISEKDKGIYDAMNKGIAVATGDVIGIINSDDIYAANDVLLQIMSAFDQNKEVDLIYGDISYFRNNEVNKITRYWKSKSYYTKYFNHGEVPPHPSLFVRKSVYDRFGKYDISFQIASDHDFMFRTMKKNGVKSMYIPLNVVKMREGGKSTNGMASYKVTFAEIRRIWDKNGYKYPFFLDYFRLYKKVKQLLVK